MLVEVEVHPLSLQEVGVEEDPFQEEEVEVVDLNLEGVVEEVDHRLEEEVVVVDQNLEVEEVGVVHYLAVVVDEVALNLVVVEEEEVLTCQEEVEVGEEPYWDLQFHSFLLTVFDSRPPLTC